MVNRTAAALVAATFLILQCLSGPALAENQIGYQLLSAEQAAGLSAPAERLAWTSAARSRAPMAA